MKKTRVLATSEFPIDAVANLFVGWLRLRGALSAFRLNCGFDAKHDSTFRIVLRSRIRNVVHSSRSCIGDLISTSFLFTDTSEGYAFWTDLSNEWRRFCFDFQDNFK